MESGWDPQIDAAQTLKFLQSDMAFQAKRAWASWLYNHQQSRKAICPKNSRAKEKLSEGFCLSLRKPFS